MYIYIYIYVYVYVYIYIYSCLYLFLGNMCTYIYIHMYIHPGLGYDCATNKCEMFRIIMFRIIPPQQDWQTRRFAWKV